MGEKADSEMLNIRVDSSSNTFRRARILRLKKLTDDIIAQKGHCKIIDLGGTTQFWQVWSSKLDFRNIEVHCYNINTSHAHVDGVHNVSVQYGDVTCLSGVGDNEHDIAFSNSVIEHVGLWSAQEAMAREVKRVARNYFVQTPYFWFPVEPHARTAFLHWLPESWSYRLLLRRDHGFWPRQTTIGGAVSMLQSARMLDAMQFQALFNDAEIIRERFFGLTKSLIAVRIKAPALNQPGPRRASGRQ